MKWIEVSVETTPAGIEPVCARIIALGIEGMQIEDYEDFSDFLESNKEAWDYVDPALVEQKKAPAAVKVYLPDNPQGRDALAALRADMAVLPELVPELDLGTLEIKLDIVDEEDWENSWKQYYKPTPIGEKLIIVPEWEPAPETDRVVFINDPGMAFGTGTHASTRLALEALEKHIRQGDTLLDIGCGSGILAICGLLMGAGQADAVDIDSNAVDIAARNARLNGIPTEKFRAYAGNILTDDSLSGRFRTGKYRIVLANIIADVINRLPETVAAALCKGGIFIASGIIEHRLGDVAETLERSGMEIVETSLSEGWACITARTAKKEEK
jgi:ribosomal protein L11 methyltransferase